MPFEPKNITKDHVLKAIDLIKTQNLELIPSTGYDVIIGGELYPPKEVMRYAHKQMNGEHLWEYAGGDATNKFLRKMGFDIKEKSIGLDPVADMIRRYKERNRETRMGDEFYKWELTKKYYHRPDLDEVNFQDEYKSIDYSNLIYYNAKGVGNHIVKERTEKFREQFVFLFDESIDLQTRVTKFNTETLAIYREIWSKESDSHHQDERTIATYLAYYDANKYPFYKDSFYRKYCDIIGVKIKPTGEKYLHYIQLLDDLIGEYIIPDKELLELKAECIPEEGHEDKSHYILAQDILYQMLDKKAEGERRYWRVGTTDGDKKYWDLMQDQCHVSVGWPELKDLSEKEIKSKNDVIKLFDQLGYYEDNKSLKTRKAGEIINFFLEMNPGDVVLAQEGQKVLGIGIITEDYYYREEFDFPHTKAIDWKHTEDINLKNNTGLQTTVYELKDPVLIDAIDDLLKTEINRKMENIFSLNTILYGPPGTGKTYHTIDMAVEIAAPVEYDSDNHFLPCLSFLR
ncbi:MAG: hypothetical protein KAS71_06625 [Bacteroidales bacterium]|nr:hypothetical protein [Bacteroidales bacterium]